MSNKRPEARMWLQRTSFIFLRNTSRSKDCGMVLGVPFGEFEKCPILTFYSECLLLDFEVPPINFMAPVQADERRFVSKRNNLDCSTFRNILSLCSGFLLLKMGAAGGS